MKRLSVLLFLLFLPALAACSSKKTSDPAETKPAATRAPAAPSDPFPLHAGNYWIYKGQVKWTDTTTEPQGIAEATMTWKMEVVRTMNVGKYDVAVMKGHPSDLAWYEKDKPRSDYLIVRDGGTYYRVDGAAISDTATLDSKLDFNSMFLKLPPPKGCIARDPEIDREDTMYCWAANETKQIHLEGVSRVSPQTEFTAFELAMRSLPEHNIVSFAEGVGMTAYIYGHHGTVSEVDVKLIEFHAAK